MAKKFTSQPLPLGAELDSGEFYRADLELHDVDHSGVSYEGRVFFNNPNADEETPTDLEHGYAGSFHIFGHGKCYGGVGHCDLKTEKRPYDKRARHPITPIDIFVPVTDALKEVIKQGGEVTVTVVPVIRAADDELDMENSLKFKDIRISAYDRPDA